MITVICPVYNEEKHIRVLIDFFLSAKPYSKELYIMDGKSTDQTRAIVSGYCSSHASVKLLDNPDRTVPYALNKAIEASTGDPVIRLDAHTTYAPDYFEKILETFEKTGADIVGGPMRAIGKSVLQQAVATVTSTSFGIGDSSFHDQTKRGYAESVYLGAWKRSVFKDTGLFDTQLKRNQDDEFHYRARSLGKKIFLEPDIISWYLPRDSIDKLFSQYFQYGLYKPLVLKKVRSGIRIRHLVPAGFVLYMLFLPFLYFFISWTVLLPLSLYIMLDIYFSFRFGKSAGEKLYSLLLYPVLHSSYGSGFIAGVFKKK